MESKMGSRTRNKISKEYIQNQWIEKVDKGNKDKNRHKQFMWGTSNSNPKEKRKEPIGIN